MVNFGNKTVFPHSPDFKLVSHCTLIKNLQFCNRQFNRMKLSDLFGLMVWILLPDNRVHCLHTMAKFLNDNEKLPSTESYVSDYHRSQLIIIFQPKQVLPLVNFSTDPL